MPVGCVQQQRGDYHLFVGAVRILMVYHGLMYYEDGTNEIGMKFDLLCLDYCMVYPNKYVQSNTLGHITITVGCVNLMYYMNECCCCANPHS